MFPDLERLEYNRPARGKAFQVLVESKGIGVSRRAVGVDREQWDRCVVCPGHRDCYELSLARLLLAQTAGNIQ
ncbi:MAG: hypothetical protein A2506_09835 [Elusimicrobia bacterium RIFOXYD12_FULL_66_9]|nr:MAG: hypothetical protein A2506_09835 [Elusimicrobia bacterium RIFOXYD12_FULL_66_9]